MKISKLEARALGLIPDEKLKGQAKKDEEQRCARKELILQLFHAHGITDVTPEYEWGWEAPPHPKTGKPRKWRADWCIGPLLVDEHGGIWTGGHHSHGKDQEDDFEKLREAQILGWVYLIFTPEQMESGKAMEIIKRALEAVP